MLNSLKQGNSNRTEAPSLEKAPTSPRKCVSQTLTDCKDDNTASQSPLSLIQNGASLVIMHVSMTFCKPHSKPLCHYKRQRQINRSSPIPSANVAEVVYSYRIRTVRLMTSAVYIYLVHTDTD